MQKLRIIVDNPPENILGLGSIVDLADAKSKQVNQSQRAQMRQPAGKTTLRAASAARATSERIFPCRYRIPARGRAGAGQSWSRRSTAADPVDPQVLKMEAERIAAIEKVRPAVVAVFSPGGSGGGSGVLIDEDGYALTNFHVTSAAGGPSMKCGLPDGVLYDAVLVGLDKVGDVALIKLLPKKAGRQVPLRQAGRQRQGARPATGRWRWATRSCWPPTSRRP